MNRIFYFTVFQYFTIWFIGWGIWVFLVKKNLNYVKTYRIATIYFLFLSIIVLFFYKPYLTFYFHNFPFKLFPFYIVILFFLISSAVYFFAKKIFGNNFLSLHLANNLFFATMSFRFLLAKSFDILFQQLLLLSLVLSFRTEGFNILQIISLVTIFFGLSHVFLLGIRSDKITFWFVLASFFAGAIFSSLILLSPYGFIYSYLIHWSFYIAIGIFLNVKLFKLKKNRNRILIDL